MGDPPFAIALQAVGTLMVAALLWQLTHLIPARSLRYWSLAWVCLSIALFSMRLGLSNILTPAGETAAHAFFLLGEYCFGFLLWAGFRDYASDQPLTRRELWYIVPFAAFALLSPWFISRTVLLPIHIMLMAGFFGSAFWASLGILLRGRRPAAGLTIVRTLLAGLAVILFLYGPLYATTTIETIQKEIYRVVQIYYSLVHLGLAFGLVIMVAERAQQTLEMKNQELAEASRRDALTGLYNRRHFNELLGGLLELHPSRGALAVIDVNDLKLINDRYLHTSGDAVLKLVARSLVTRFRVSDPIFRVGGDEFVVVMPGSTASELAARLAEVDESLLNQRVPGVNEPLNIRIAWGLATFNELTSLTAAFEGADQAMFACKTERKADTNQP